MLAAGVGQRLRQAENVPKCLLKIGHRSLLERHFSALAHNGITALHLVVGFEAALIKRACTEAFSVSFYENPAYREGSIVSLWAARDILGAGRDVLLMDADVLYPPTLLQTLIAAPHENCLLLDRDFEMGEEPVKICVNGDTIVEFRKQIMANVKWDLCGESVGFFKFSATAARRLVERAEHYVASGRRDVPYEEAIRDLILARDHAISYADITGLPWLEIDFPKDLQRAREEIAPRIDALN